MTKTHGVCAALLAVSVLALVPGEAAHAASTLGTPGSISASWNTTTPTTLDVTWTSPGGAYLEYEVLYRVDTDAVFDPSPSYPPTGWLTPSGVSTVRTTSASILDLATTDSHVVAVRARDRQTGAYSTWGTSALIEPSGTPDRVSGITETARTSSSVTLSWAKAAGASGGYDVRVSESTSPRAWGTPKSVAQPGSGSSVSATVGTAHLPSGYSASATYVAQVRSRSASGTCGTPSVKCSRWVESGALAQLDISGLSAAKMQRTSYPSWLRLDTMDMDVVWGALAVTGASYEVRFYFRNGDPASYYDATDDNNLSNAKPDNWLMDWQWYRWCNDDDTSTNPPGSRGCADPFFPAKTYQLPVFSFGPAVWGSWVPLTATQAKCNADTRCEHTFSDVTVRGLTARAQVRAVLAGARGPAAQYTSLPPRVTGPPYGLAASSPTGGSFKVEWNRPFHRGSPISGFDVHLIDTSAPATPVQTVTGTSAAPDATKPYRFSYTFHGLTAGKTYRAGVRVVNGVGPSGWAQSPSVTLAAGKPATPLLSVAPGEQGSGKLTLTGELSDSGGTAISRWDYRPKTGASTYGAWAAVANSAASSLRHVISDLTNGTSYTYQVRACNSSGCSTPSSDGTSSPVALPVKPTWGYSPAGNGAVDLWASVPTGGPSLVGWEYSHVRASHGNPWANASWVRVASTGRQFEHRVTGLSNGTRYGFKVRAVSAAGPGPESDAYYQTPNEGTTPTVQLALTPSTVSEGGSVTVTASFPWGSWSTADTTITISAAAVSPTDGDDFMLGANRTLIIPAYSQSSRGTVTIATTDDAIDETDNTLTVSAAVSSAADQSVTAPGAQTLTITDDDTAAVEVSTPSVALAEGASQTYTVKLGSQPTHAVTVSIGATNSHNVTVSPASLTFTTADWAQHQTVTVTSAHDSDGDSGSFDISHTPSGSDAVYRALLAAKVAVTVTDDDSPSAMAAPTVAPGGTSLAVSWSPPTSVGSGGATIAGYEVRYALTPALGVAPSWTTVTPSPATATSHTISDLVAGNGYDVSVRAKNSNNLYSPWSPAVSMNTDAPPPPGSFTLTPGNGSLTASWTKPAGATISLYQMSWTCGGGSGSAFPLATATSHTISNLANGVACTVTISAWGYISSGTTRPGGTATATATPTG